jgi:hypothetical protein
METGDWRQIKHGWVIPSSFYADQPYVVQTDDQAWLCAMTVGSGEEGRPGQHVVTRRSLDRGRSWSAAVAVEPEGGPEASYSVLLKATGGRIYCFYNHNTDNQRTVKADSPPYPNGLCERVDSLGHFVFKFSDDYGRTWSARRYEIPIREFAIDRENPYAGVVRFMWNVGRPFTSQGIAFVPLTKVGGFGEGFFTRSEGCLLASDNLLTEMDPTRIFWRTLPEGEIGLRAPNGGGPISEEHSFAGLSDGSFFCVNRTTDGYPAQRYSRDGGKTWLPPAWLTYADGRPIKHPRAANFVWKCANGKFLYWFHNHGGRSYEDRNPAWLCGGTELATAEGLIIAWSQPEIVLYDDDPFIRMSYPDLIEAGEDVYLTETQKNVARVHQLDRTLLDGLWAQASNREISQRGLLTQMTSPSPRLAAPQLPDFLEKDETRPDYATRDLRGGFTLDLWIRIGMEDVPGSLIDGRAEDGRGLILEWTDRGTVILDLSDGRTRSSWECDRGEIRPGQVQSVTVIVDGGPKLILFVIDGRLNDGGQERQFGWGRFSPQLRSCRGRTTWELAPSVETLRVYGRALRVSEAIGNFQGSQ